MRLAQLMPNGSLRSAGISASLLQFWSLTLTCQKRLEQSYLIVCAHRDLLDLSYFSQVRLGKTFSKTAMQSGYFLTQ